ncbi:hypothetical protein EZS27_004081 [termite gut metagenome]|uniref:SHOCT domain-containing protein n=1 Tax=termite gut metagenome TaxID=433724 RepID=A0A5J4SSU7_9ZZZZ
MAGKLKDDQIRWILDVEAKGVQAELQKVISSTDKLAQSNKRMTAEQKAAKDQAYELLKQMNALEKQGEKTSDAYKKYEDELNSVRGEIDDYTKKIVENNKAIRENEKQKAEIIKTMQVEDMTMSQLKKRANDLQKQLNNTSLSADPKTYQQLNKELSVVKDRMNTVGNSQKSLLQQFAGMSNPVGTAAKSVQGFGTAMKALAANPVGAVIMAIVVAFTAIKTAIQGSDSARTKLEGWMKAFTSILDSGKRILTEYWALLYNVFTLNFSAAKENISNLKEIGSNLAGNAKAAYDAAIAEDALNDAIAKNNDITAVNKSRIEELRQVSQDTSKSMQERKKASEELLQLERDNYKMAVSNVTGAYTIFRNQNKNLIDAMKKGSSEQFAQVEKYMQLVQSGTELTYQQRLELAALVNDITATLDEGTEEEKEQFRKFFTDLSVMQQDFFAGSRRDAKKANQLKEEEAKLRAENAKKALEKALKDEDNALQKEINLLKEKRLQGELTEKEYNKKLEELTIESLHRKITIKGQEKEKILQLQGQVLDAQLKQQQTADKELLDEMQKEKDRQLAILQTLKQEQLEKLQEEEKDQTIYAIRAKEIEANTAQARLKVLQQFGETLQEAEFNNAQTQAEAILQNGTLILSAEEEVLKNRENVHKLTAKTISDFEKKYHTQTLEQRKEDELNSIQRLKNENLISEEAYQIAVNAIEEKYEKEKVNVRKQHGLVSMQEQHQLEMDALREQHQQGLLTEEEYEEAKLQLKLKYASSIAQKIGEFAKTGADLVQAAEKKETNAVNAEYAKRQSALEQQYNQGILSQEEYNKQKEQLDYEEKVQELEIQKKYADANFAMQAAQIIASGALAAINAYAAMASIPIVGPGLGIAAAAMVAATTALQLNQAKAERDRVKTLTIENTGAAAATKNAAKTGQVLLNEGFAQGGYNDEGYTGSGSKYTVKGYFPNGKPYHAGEYIIPQDVLNRPVVIPMVRQIEAIRRQRTGANPLPGGFAEGGYNGEDGQTQQQLMELSLLIARLSGVLDRLQQNGVSVNYYEFEKAKETVEKVRAGAQKN